MNRKRWSNVCVAIGAVFLFVYGEHPFSQMTTADHAGCGFALAFFLAAALLG